VVTNFLYNYNLYFVVHILIKISHVKYILETYILENILTSHHYPLPHHAKKRILRHILATFSGGAILPYSPHTQATK
jgi:hypothetical protein